ncbi:MAG: fatty acid desaturase family protein [Planctomycetota bacterium]
MTREDLAPFCVRRDAVAAATWAAVVLGILLTLLLHVYLAGPITFVLAFLLIGGFQHHLSVIHHEAVHYLLFRKRSWNEFAGRFLAAYPIGFTMTYRRTHLAHHRHLGDENDPDLPNYLDFPAPGGIVVAAILKDLSFSAAGAQLLGMLGVGRRTGTSSRPSQTRREWLGLIGVQGAIFTALALVGHWPLYFSLWILPLGSWAKLLAHVRNLAEHVDVRDDSAALPRWRTFRCGLIERFFLAPLNFNYHAEHHLFPQVPFYHLPALHRRLMCDPSYGRQVNVRDGYVRFLWARVWLRGHRRTTTAPLAGA